MVEYQIFSDDEQALNALHLTYNLFHRTIRLTDSGRYEHAREIPAGNQTRFFDPGETFSLLSSHNISTARYKVVSIADEGVKTAQKIVYLVVLKVVKPHILHKTEVKGVKLNIGSDDGLKISL